MGTLARLVCGCGLSEFMVYKRYLLKLVPQRMVMGSMQLEVRWGVGGKGRPQWGKLSPDISNGPREGDGKVGFSKIVTIGGCRRFLRALFQLVACGTHAVCCQSRRLKVVVRKGGGCSPSMINVSYM